MIYNEGDIENEVEAVERELIAGIMDHPQHIPATRLAVKHDTFCNPAHGRIYAALLHVADAGDATDLTRVSLALRAQEAFVAADMIVLGRVASAAPIEILIERNVKLVREASRMREFASRAWRWAREARETGVLSEPEGVQNFFNQAAAELQPFFAQSSSSKTSYGATEMSRELDALIRLRRENEGKITGIPTGYPAIDQHLGGLQRKSLYVLAASTGAGKTAFALNVVRNASHRAHARSLVVSLEMDRVELWSRLLSAESRVGGMKIQTGIISDAEDARLAMGHNEMRKLLVTSLEPPPTTLVALRAEAQLAARRDGLDILVVDYLQLMNGSGKDRHNREREVAEISRGLKLLAMELGIAVIAVSQLNRAGDRNAKPSLSNLRESGAIEQDANAVIFLWADDDVGREVNWAIAKNRSGPLGEGRLLFERSTQRFENTRGES